MAKVVAHVLDWQDALAAKNLNGAVLPMLCPNFRAANGAATPIRMIVMKVTTLLALSGVCSGVREVLLTCSNEKAPSAFQDEKVVMDPHIPVATAV